ncbi:MAG: 50S ribosomal protein L32 [Leptospiraceae bacterium]|jgi:large subunit ribosomal protein L32|nr:50S ribosomal protein L32 [Leptospiraceae bacterium]MBK7053987.1 50S ribosomal protein L32 [Leptospiraceae bacterium]MBK9499889.1 50S ribosomal protein L32 [Leptospiraceae bacterium]MBL0262555.1 50S ribosomal protein L32 [Leptospiraceae bacterium]MBP9163747.1 50S ribosomal protein L32 [Leptospiraceae bacterium]
MAVPKKRKSKSKVRSHRAHHAIGKPNLVPCSNCSAFILSHRVCPACGFYNGKLVVAPKIKKSKQEE